MRLVFVLVFLCVQGLQSLKAQSAPLTYLISFTDKNSSPYSVTNPSAYLSSRAINRRATHNIAIDITDLPVNPWYLDSLKAITGVNVIAKSKWFNNATVMVTDTVLLSQIHALPFVASIKSSSLAHTTHLSKQKLEIQQQRNNVLTKDSTDYGFAANQIKQLHGDFLHQMGFTGSNMQIAVIDAGFREVNTLPQYEHLRSKGKIIEGPDFVRRDGTVYNDPAIHGTLVMSCMAPNVAGEFIGTAPNATYYLLISENDSSEYLVEEDYWIAAAEWADSAGADVFNTSLGYTEFDDTLMNHTYADMDGNTTRITNGVDMVAKKGILSVNSAGNSGNNAWYYIGAPADADSCLAVGAVDANGVYASFSSKGPSADGRTKPNVATQGSNSVLIWPGNIIATGSGTSFAGPIMAGMAACLWEAFPTKSNMEILRAIEFSASKFANPDDFIGHGIPDLSKAWHYLNNTTITNDTYTTMVLNNPFIDNCNFVFYSGQNRSLDLLLYDLSGNLIVQKNIVLTQNQHTYYTLDVKDKLLRAGVYVLKLMSEGQTRTLKLVKQ